MKEKIKADHEKKLLDVLKKYGRTAETKLAFLAFGHANNMIILKYLEKLEKEGKVKREKETRGTYWSIVGRKKKWKW